MQPPTKPPLHPRSVEIAATFQAFVIGTLSDRLTVSYRQVGDLLQALESKPQPVR